MFGPSLLPSSHDAKPQTNTDSSSSLANPIVLIPIALFAWPNELDNIQAQDMLPSPAEQQKLFLQLLAGMPPVEHEMFLGNWLYFLVQVHHICSLFP